MPFSRPEGVFSRALNACHPSLIVTNLSICGPPEVLRSISRDISATGGPIYEVMRSTAQSMTQLGCVEAFPCSDGLVTIEAR